MPGVTFAIDNTRQVLTPHLAKTTFSGTVTQPGEYDVTLKITDIDGDATSGTFKIFVNAAPSFAAARVPSKVFAIGEEGTIVLPAISLGNGKWFPDHRLSLTPLDLEAHLDVPRHHRSCGANFQAARRGPAHDLGRDGLHGRNQGLQAERPFRPGLPPRSGSASAWGTASRARRVSASDTTVEPQTYRVDKAIAPLTLPELSLATGTPAYSLTGLPPGLSFDTGTRTLSGAPTKIGSFTATYKATDDAETEASLTFTIDVTGFPSFAMTRVPSFVFAIGQPREIALPALTLGNGAVDEHRFDWTPNLPAWLALDKSNPAALKLRGTAPEGSNKNGDTYRLRVWDRALDYENEVEAAQLLLCFSVGDGEPCGVVSFDNATVDDQTWTKGRRITAADPAGGATGNGCLDVQP